jgi:hypothetical protein
VREGPTSEGSHGAAAEEQKVAVHEQDVAAAQPVRNLSARRTATCHV